MLTRREFGQAAAGVEEVQKCLDYARGALTT